MKLYIGYLKSHFKAFYYINIIPPINFIVNMKIIMPNGIYLYFDHYLVLTFFAVFYTIYRRKFYEKKYL